MSENRTVLSGENNPMRNKHHTKESRRKIRENHADFKGEKHPKGMLGKHHSDELKKDFSEKRRTPFEKILKIAIDRGYEILSKKEDYKNQFSKLKFRCLNGHIFKMRWDGFRGGQNCPYCKNPSKPQTELFNLVKEDHPEAILEYPCLKYSIDIVIPNLKIAIEYDGSYWHQDKEYDDKRQKEIEEQGWTFLRYIDQVPSKYKLRKDLNILINENKI